MTNLEQHLLAAAKGRQAPDPVRDLVTEGLRGRADNDQHEHNDNEAPALNSPQIEALLRAGLTDTQEKN